MPRDRLVLVKDALDAALDIVEFLSEKSLDDYLKDRVLQAAIERKVEIIGEALNVARRIDPLLEEAITDLPQIVRMRNFLSHAYHSVIHPRLHEITRQNLPLLIRELKFILENEPANEDEPLD